jgi:U-box domain
VTEHATFSTFISVNFPSILQHSHNFQAAPLGTSYPILITNSTNFKHLTMTASSSATESSIAQSVIPTEYICALTKKMMTNPLMSVTGYNFQREAILAWVDMHGTCPVTQKSLSKSKIVTNHALRIQIQFWCKNHGIASQLVSSEHPHDTDDDCCMVQHKLDSLSLEGCRCDSCQARRQQHTSWYAVHGPSHTSFSSTTNKGTN